MLIHCFITPTIRITTSFVDFMDCAIPVEYVVQFVYNNVLYNLCAIFYEMILSDILIVILIGVYNMPLNQRMIQNYF
jgi:hypothetical protein